MLSVNLVDNCFEVADRSIVHNLVSIGSILKDAFWTFCKKLSGDSLFRPYVLELTGQVLRREGDTFVV